MAGNVSLEELFIDLVVILSSSLLSVNRAFIAAIDHISDSPFVLLPGQH